MKRLRVLLLGDFLDKFTEKSRPAINVSCVYLEKFSSGLEFFARRFRIENAAAGDDRQSAARTNGPNHRRRFFAQRFAAQSTSLIERRRNRAMIERRVGCDDSGD